MGHLIRRDLVRAFAGGGPWLPIVFFLLAITLYPFAVGPDARLLARTGGGVLWIAALLAAILPIDRLVAPDHQAGVLDQIAVRGLADEWVALGKIIAHWLSFGPALMLAALVGGAMLRLEGETLIRVEIGLVLATPALAALAVMVASLTAGLRGAAALNGLIALPLAVPLLIFGAGSLAPAASTQGLKWLAAAALLMFAGAPVAAGAGLRALRG